MGHIPSGALIDGRYVAGDEIGEGGAAVVYRVRHVSLGSEHAIKVSKYGSPSIVRRILAEGRAQAGVVHPNIVRVTDSCVVGGAPALVMELVRGPSLDVLIDRMRLEQAQIDELARGIFAGVSAAHALGIVHRDLKPGNILIDVTGDRPIPKIADFGLVKAIDPAPPGGPRTRPGMTLGTPEYMAPEQMRNATEIDSRADVFSLGAVLYELVTGTGCFFAADPCTTFQRIADGEYRPVQDLAPLAPERVIRAIAAALEPDRDRRCPSVDALAALWFEGAPDTDAGNAWHDATFRSLVVTWRARTEKPVELPARAPPPRIAAPTCTPTAIALPDPPLMTHPSTDPLWLATRGPGSTALELGPWPTPVPLDVSAARHSTRGVRHLAAGVALGGAMVGLAFAFGFRSADRVEVPDPAPTIQLECSAPPAAAPPVSPTESKVVVEKRPGLFKRMFGGGHPERRETARSRRD